jgi:hypothetical protein
MSSILRAKGVLVCPHTEAEGFDEYGFQAAGLEVKEPSDDALSDLGEGLDEQRTSASSSRMPTPTATTPSSP